MLLLIFMIVLLNKIILIEWAFAIECLKEKLPNVPSYYCQLFFYRGCAPANFGAGRFVTKFRFASARAPEFNMRQFMQQCLISDTEIFLAVVERIGRIFDFARKCDIDYQMQK